MKINTRGISRIVFIFKYYVIKIPNYRFGMLHFLQGCYANWSERHFCKSFKNEDNVYENLYKYVAPSYFCSWFGLLQIQAKCKPLLRDLTNEEKIIYKPLCGKDNKSENFGWYKEKLVCLDYV